MRPLEQVLALAQRELQAALGGNLISLTLIGSAAAGDFVPDASDVNLLAVLKRIDLAALDAVRGAHRRFARFRVSTPVLLTPEDLARSGDVFPIEFLEMQEKRRVLVGPDLLAKLKVGVKNLRHECEHELKGRMIRLRESYLELGDHPRRLQALLTAAHAANLPAFRAALRLKRSKPPLAKDEVLERLAAVYRLDRTPFDQIQALHRKQLRLGRGGLRDLFAAYLHEVEKLARVLDRM
jgi:hypothetical protein